MNVIIRCQTYMLVVMLVFCLLGVATFNATLQSKTTQQSYTTAELRVQAMLFNTTNHQLVENVRVYFYKGFTIVIEVTTKREPQVVSLEEGEYTVIAEYDDSRVSEIIYIKRGLGSLTVYIDPNYRTVMYIDYIYLAGPENYITVDVCARYFNFSSNDYILGVMLTFYNNGSVIKQVTTALQPVSVSLAVDRSYLVEIRYKNDVKYMSMVLDSRRHVNKYLLIVFLYKNNCSIVLAGLFVREPYIYESETTTIHICAVDDRTHTYIPGITVLFFRFYENGSILLEKSVTSANHSVFIHLKLGYYLVLVQSTNDSIMQILELTPKYPFYMYIVVNTTTGRITDIELYMALPEYPGSLNLFLSHWIFVLIVITITAVFLTVAILRIKRKS